MEVATSDIDFGEARERAAPGAILCLVSPTLPSDLRMPLMRHLEQHGPTQALVERRVDERRRNERRSRRGANASSAAGQSGALPRERRRIRSADGRRVAERRATLVEVAPPALPGAIHPHATELRFVRRAGPGSQSREDSEATRLLIRMQAGDEAAFIKLHDRYAGAVFRYLRTVLGDQHEAEDGTQEVWARMVANLADFEIRGVPFRVWLFRVARNWALTHREKRARSVLEDPATIARRLTCDGQRELWERLPDGDLLRLLRSIPLAQRQVLVLRHVADLSVAEVAEVLGRSPNAVDHLHRRAVAFLADRMATAPEPGAGRNGHPSRLAMRRLVRETPVLSARRLRLGHTALR